MVNRSNICIVVILKITIVIIIIIITHTQSTNGYNELLVSTKVD